MNYDHPPTKDIKPYVSFGPSKDLSVTVHKKTFDTLYYAVLFFFFLIMLIAIIMLIYFSIQVSTLPPPPDGLIPITETSTIPKNIGATSHGSTIIKYGPEDGSSLTNKNICNNSSHGSWENDKCICGAPFFGPQCSRERYDKKYHAIGIPNESELKLTIIEDINSNGKSFNKDNNEGSCSNICDKTENCIGFIYYNENICTLLSEKVIIPENSTIQFSDKIDSTLYLKNLNNLYFEGKVYLTTYAWSFPEKYWLVEESPYYKKINRNIITKIDFLPGYAKNYNNYTGIYCLHKFVKDEIKILLNRGCDSQTYIHNPGEKLNLPISWKYGKSIYVVYI